MSVIKTSNIHFSSWGAWSLTGGDGPDFAAAAHAGLVGGVDVAVVVGGGLQVLHHGAGGGDGQVQRLSGALRADQEVVVVCRGLLLPLYPDGGAGKCLANLHLRCVGHWEAGAGQRTASGMLQSIEAIYHHKLLIYYPVQYSHIHLIPVLSLIALS